MKYRDYQPTGFDKHIKIEGREDWEVIPFISRNRDSKPLDITNFEYTQNALEGVQQEGENWEIIRFRHWACGWFEIIIFNNEAEDIKNKVEDIEELYRNHIILDEERYMEMIKEIEEENEEESG